MKSPSSGPGYSGAGPNVRENRPRRAHLHVRFDTRCQEAGNAERKATALGVPADLSKDDAERMARIDESIAHAKATAVRAAQTATAKPRIMML